MSRPLISHYLFTIDAACWQQSFTIPFEANDRESNFSTILQFRNCSSCKYFNVLLTCDKDTNIFETFKEDKLKKKYVSFRAMSQFIL